jgi:hypothetical protein
MLQIDTIRAGERWETWEWCEIFRVLLISSMHSYATFI